MQSYPSNIKSSAIFWISEYATPLVERVLSIIRMAPVGTTPDIASISLTFNPVFLAKLAQVYNVLILRLKSPSVRSIRRSITPALSSYIFSSSAM